MCDAAAFRLESWHGRMKAWRGIGASSLTADEISKFKNEIYVP